jgi:hypothetical protein
VARPRVRPHTPRMSFRPFRIEFTERAIADLQRRPDVTRWPPMASDTGGSAPRHDRVLRDFGGYWRPEFDWFRMQAELDALAHVCGANNGDETHAVRYTRLVILSWLVSVGLEENVLEAGVRRRRAL